MIVPSYFTTENRQLCKTSVVLLVFCSYFVKISIFSKYLYYVFIHIQARLSVLFINSTSYRFRTKMQQTRPFSKSLCLCHHISQPTFHFQVFSRQLCRSFIQRLPTTYNYKISLLFCFYSIGTFTQIINLLESP